VRTDVEGAVRAGAEEYVRKSPHQVSTAYRELIIAALGWTY
jgi:hypothetical protein